MRSQRDAGFTVIEAMVAVTVLAVAVVLTIQPVMGALRRVSDARAIEVAENLAQAEIESLRALDYEDVGMPGRTPSGVLDESRVVDVEGRLYTIELEVWYAGSLTGLDVVPQGGDGVEGSWDPGVDYKAIKVTVTPEGRERDPIIMETIVAPRTLGAHEAIANARIYVAAYEPFAPSDFILPSLEVVSAPAAPIKSPLRASEVVFPAIPPGWYDIRLNVADGWAIHPDDVTSGAARIQLVAGTLAQTTIRVYRPAGLAVTVLDDTTGNPISGARLTLKNLATSQTTAYSPGVLSVTGLVPDAYDVTISASGYQTSITSSVNIPGGYPSNPNHTMTVRLVPGSGTATTTTTTAPSVTTTTAPGATTTTAPGVTTTTTKPPSTTTTTIAMGSLREVRFTVKDNTGREIRGATVTVNHPNRGILTATTDEDGRAYLALERDYVFTAVASTPWGHGNGQASFDPAKADKVDLSLTRPAGHGLMGLKGGKNAEFLFRPSGTTVWKVMPVNDGGEASFVGPPGTYEVAKRCTKNGNIVDQRSVTIAFNENRTTELKTKC